MSGETQGSATSTNKVKEEEERLGQWLGSSSNHPIEPHAHISKHTTCFMTSDQDFSNSIEKLMLRSNYDLKGERALARGGAVTSGIGIARGPGAVAEGGFGGAVRREARLPRI